MNMIYYSNTCVCSLLYYLHGQDTRSASSDLKEIEDDIVASVMLDSLPDRYVTDGVKVHVLTTYRYSSEVLASIV